MGAAVRKRRWALAATAAAIALLLMPWRAAPEGGWVDAAGNTAHVLLFAALAWLWGRTLPEPNRGWRLWVALALLAAAVEGLQIATGRTARASDGLLGAAGAACICATWGSQRIRWLLRWGTLLVLGLVPPAWSSAWVMFESRAFPVLLAPDAAWSRRGWTLNGVRLASASTAGLRFEQEMAPGKGRTYPGMFRPCRPGDWRGLKCLRAELFWPADTPAVFAIRVDDQPGNPEYAERFQREFTATQGWNSIAIPAAELQRAAGGRLLALDAIRQWGVFLVSEVPFDYFLVGPVRLEMQKETP